MTRLPLAELEDLLVRERPSEPFSGVVSLRRGRTVLFERACGLAERSESIPNRLDTRFQIASGCKVFTSIAICRLIDEGRIAPGTLLRDCVGVPLPHLAPEITVQHLLTHTSGVPDYFDESVMDDYEALWQLQPMYAMRRPSDFLPLFADRPMQAPPGARFAYSNAGFILLGLIVEHVTGAPFAEHVAEHVLAPCGMADSGYFAADQLPPRTARAYVQNDDGTWRSTIYAVPVVGGPDGGAYTTAEDMARFWEALAGHVLLRPETTARLLSLQVATGRARPYDGYGLGVWIESDGDAIRKRFLEGADPGVAFRSAVYPAHGLTLTLLGNTAEPLWSLFREIEELIGA